MTKVAQKAIARQARQNIVIKYASTILALIVILAPIIIPAIGLIISIVGLAVIVFLFFKINNNREALMTKIGANSQLFKGPIFFRNKNLFQDELLKEQEKVERLKTTSIKFAMRKTADIGVIYIEDEENFKRKKLNFLMEEIRQFDDRNALILERTTKKFFGFISESQIRNFIKAINENLKSKIELDDMTIKDLYENGFYYFQTAKNTPFLSLNDKLINIHETLSKHPYGKIIVTETGDKNEKVEGFVDYFTLLVNKY